VDKALEVAEQNDIKDFQKMAKIFARKGTVYDKQKKYKEAAEWFQKSLLENADEKVKNDHKRTSALAKDQESKDYVDP